MKTDDYDLHRSIVEFQGKVELAEPGDIIEAPEAFLLKHNPKGLPRCGFMDYKGVRACMPGKTHEVEAYLNRTQEEVTRERAPFEKVKKTT